MVKVKGKVFRVGNSYAILIRKALVDCEVLKEGETYEFKLQDGAVVCVGLYDTSENSASMLA